MPVLLLITSFSHSFPAVPKAFDELSFRVLEDFVDLMPLNQESGSWQSTAFAVHAIAADSPILVCFPSDESQSGAAKNQVSTRTFAFLPPGLRWLAS